MIAKIHDAGVLVAVCLRYDQSSNRVLEVAHFESCYHMIGSTESTLALPKVSPGYVRKASTKNISDRTMKESRLGMRRFANSGISDFRYSLEVISTMIDMAKI